MAGAVVVDVLALLGLRGVSTPASSTGDESGERVPPLRVARAVRRGKDLLHAVEEPARDDRRVQALVQLPEPVELAVVDRVVQQLVDLRLDERRAARAVRQPGGGSQLRERLQRVLA